MERAADRIVVAPEALRRRLADDHHRRRRRACRVGEVAAAQQRNAHRLEEPRAHDPPVGRNRRVRRQRRLAGGRRSASSCSCPRRTECRSRHRRPRTPGIARSDSSSSGRTRALSRRRICVRGSDSWNVSRPPGWKPSWTRCSSNSVCTSRPAPIEQHRRQRELRRGEAVAKARPRTARGPRRLLQHRVQVGLRRVPRRRDAEEHARSPA